jgi:hypothetical protein
MSVNRRSFLTMIGAATVAPALPMLPSAAPATALYNRYMYGLAVFHARARATLSAGDLMAKLRVSAVQARAMVGEMSTSGIVRPVAQSALGAVRAVNPTIPTVQKTTGEIGKKIVDVARSALDAIETDSVEMPGTDEPEAKDTQIDGDM